MEDVDLALLGGFSNYGSREEEILGHGFIDCRITKSVVVYAGMPNYGLEKISNYIEPNRHKVKSMPTVVSVVAIADKSTKDEFWASRSGGIYTRDVKAVSYIVDNSLASAIEVNISVRMLARSRYAGNIRDFIERIRFCREGP